MNLRLALLPIALMAGAAAQSPLIEPGASGSKVKRTAVTYLFPEQITVAAGKATPVDLHFKVADGLHVNSHTPHSDYLIPTTLDFPANSGVHLIRAIFPPGADYAFDISPKERLSVYTGEFIVHTELTAPLGEHLVEGTLHYQACNNASCMPPHSIPVAIDVIAR